MNREKRFEQKKMLYKEWGFRIRVEENNNEELYIWHLEIRNIKIVWNIKYQTGAYSINNDINDGKLNLLLNWKMLEDLMEQIK